MGTGFGGGYSCTPSSRASTGGDLGIGPGGSGGSGGESGTGGVSPAVPTISSVVKASDWITNKQIKVP